MHTYIIDLPLSWRFKAFFQNSYDLLNYLAIPTFGMIISIHLQFVAKLPKIWSLYRVRSKEWDALF